MSKKEIEEKLRDRKEDLKHVKKKLDSESVLEDIDEFSRLCKRRTELECNIEILEKELSDY